MYMLNMLFDFSRKDGIFSPERNGVLNQSKNWLKFRVKAADPEPGDPFPSPFHPEGHSWDELVNIESGALILPSVPPGQADDGHIGVRIAPDPNTPPGQMPTLGSGAGAAKLTMAVCFGRKTMTSAKFASPFMGGAPPSSRTTFVFYDLFSNTVDAGNPTGWFFHLGKVSNRPTAPPPNVANHYQFSIGIVVTATVGGCIPAWALDLP